MKKISETNIRIITAAVVAPFVILCFVNYYSFIGLVSAVVLFSNYEYLKFALKGNDHQTVRIALSGVIPAIIVVYGILLDRFGNVESAAPRPELIFAVGVISLTSIVVVTVADVRSAKEIIANAVFSLIYVGFDLAFFYHIYLGFGASMALMSLTSVWLFDTGAYFFGKRFGRIRISPSYSPKKSLEGVIGGYVTTLLFMFLFVYISKLVGLYNGPDLGIPHFMVLAIVVSVFGTIGDIAESSFKRYHGVKDSGNLLPGHGGMLDRIDGVLFVTPMFYIFLTLLT
ncbi:MAG: phosphatidate cytidylyltransferase [Mesotoga sp.]|uniref:phosphatidate cytidylyltransferase n=1 Tax=Mesotoga sp. TaxID=2053577 RepID=UPI0035695100|nr:phosphatidate cytidylyltransferase [Thermotogota bacterium]